MTLLTINTHSLLEDDYENKCRIFADAILRHKPDVIAMQEVNQSINSPITAPPENFVCAGDVVSLRQDNHALKIISMLAERGLLYNCVWLPIKCGYERYDEGMAFFSLHPIDEIYIFQLSLKNDYQNWKTRRALMIKSDGKWFCNVHMGWWDDKEEPFLAQWKRLCDYLNPLKNAPVFLMGDFNSPANENGYKLVLSSGWHDTYTLATHKDDGYTVSGKIDGWTDENTKKRIDYVFSSRKIDVKSSRIIFDGKNEGIISDHFGVIVTI